MEEETSEEESLETNYFFDSYPIIEIVKKNTNFEKYLNKDANLSIFNLAEIYYSILNNYDEEKANEVYETYKGGVVDLTDEIVKEAMKFRKLHKKEDFSYADCIGYIYAKKNNMKFLTGDKAFENLSNVEFVK